jgi:glycosyltransferase involved in cell wall biosynthesis
MRIGIIATEFPPSTGGMQVMAWNLTLALSERHELVVFTRKGSGVPSPSFETAAVLDGDMDRDIVKLASSDPGRDVDVWLAMNAGYAALAGRLDRPMAVFCNGNDFLTPWVIGTPRLFDHLERMPHVWRYAEPLRQAWRRRALKNGLSHAKAVLPISENTRDLLVGRLGIGPDRPVVINPGVEDMFFQPRPVRDGGPLELLTVARLDSRNRRKNVDGVLHAIASIGTGLDIRYTVVGDGDDRQRLEALARDLGIAERVRFTGRLDQSGILAAYRKADLFVLAAKASATDVEGFGIVYIEANASGVPVLCSRSGGAVDAVRHGESGLLIDDADPESIADGIRDFRNGSHDFDPVRIAAHAEGFRWRSVADKVEKTLLAIASERSRTNAHRLDSMEAR